MNDEPHKESLKMSFMCPVRTGISMIFFKILIFWKLSKYRICSRLIIWGAADKCYVVRSAVLMLCDNESGQNNSQLSVWLVKRKCFASETMSCWASYPGDEELVNLNKLQTLLWSFGDTSPLWTGLFFFTSWCLGVIRYILFYHDCLSLVPCLKSCDISQFNLIAFSCRLTLLLCSFLTTSPVLLICYGQWSAGLYVRRTPAHIDSDCLRISWLPELSPFPNWLMFSDLALPASARPTESIPPSVCRPISLILYLPLMYLNNV